MMYICGAACTILGLVVGFAFGALWAHRRSIFCCGIRRACTKCGKTVIIA